MSDEIDWESIRRDFPVTEQTAYLNSAAAGPVPRPVMEAATNFYHAMMSEGDARWDEWIERRETVRRRIAEFINAEPEEIALTTNTSSGMNLIVDALEGRGEVVSCDLEFPVSTITWLHRGVRVKLIETVDGELRIEDLQRALTDETAIICLSHVQYSNGFRIDLEELGRSKSNRVLVVNASQSAGAFEIDVKRMQIDALCATAHKWMLAGYGSGFVYLSRKLLDETRARAIGWLSVEEPFEMRNREVRLRHDAAARAELGCPHFAGIFALGASVEYLTKIGAQQIKQRVLALNRYLTERLNAEGWRVLSPLRDERMRSGETLIATPRPNRMAAHLAHHNIAVTEKPQGIRISTHFFNNEADIERLILTIADFGLRNAD
ncbi:MAG: cysteine desulfurase / selenocysteine lyase [Acidobacteriota bacterium]|jgi:selenocysteine lyase/cysteine desulfurase|nr:cysteine desulfurase / selenocysteine lyase [Acidobacteriota bacterium]